MPIISVMMPSMAKTERNIVAAYTTDSATISVLRLTGTHHPLCMFREFELRAYPTMNDDTPQKVTRPDETMNILRVTCQMGGATST